MLALVASQAVLLYLLTTGIESDPWPVRNLPMRSLGLSIADAYFAAPVEATLCIASGFRVDNLQL
jgi:hypothetical protein